MLWCTEVNPLVGPGAVLEVIFSFLLVPHHQRSQNRLPELKEIATAVCSSQFRLVLLDALIFADAQSENNVVGYQVEQRTFSGCFIDGGAVPNNV